MAGSTVGSRLYLVERRTGRTALAETWAPHATYTSHVRALREARKLAAEGGAFRICEYVFNRVPAVVRGY